MSTYRRNNNISSWLWLAAVSILSILPLRFGYGQGLQVRDLSISSDQLRALVSTYGDATRETQLHIQALGQETPVALPTASTFASVHLGVLVDNASVCKSLGLESMIPKMLGSLQLAFGSKSRVTVITFSGHRLEVLAQSIPMSETKKLKFACEPRAVSGSPEKALGRFIVGDDTEGLAKVAWLFTSGNLRLPAAGLAALKKSRVPLDVFLYNRPLAAALQVIGDEQSRQLNEGQYQFQVLSQANGTVNAALPARYSLVEARIPQSLAGTSVPLKIAAMKADEVVAFAETVVDVPNATGAGLLKVVLWALLVLTIAVLALVILRRRLGRRHCATCGNSVSEHGQCLYPHELHEAALVGNWLSVEQRHRHQAKVVRIDRDVFELGTHRRSRVPVVKPNGLRRACLGSIHRVRHANGEVSYRLEPQTPHGYGPLLRNGQPLLSPKHLAHGDVLEVGHVSVTFVLDQRRHEGQSQ